MDKLPEVTLGSEDPLYNIGVVTRMTSISTATLRAWERRYNFPQAERTSGGHRLYSEQDILRLRWVKQQVDSGMQTAQAINALRYQEQHGRVVSVPEPSISSGLQSPDFPHAGSFQNRLLDALLALDTQTADQVLGEALALSTPEDLILDVIAPVMAKIGEAWEVDNINIANEHLATNFLRQRLLMWMLSGPPPKPVRPIILACGPNEWHEGSLLILGALLRRRRWPIAYLGQSVPLSDLANFVREIRPSMIVLVAMLPESASELIDWPQWLPEVASSGNPPVGYGGRIFTVAPEWRIRMAGMFLGSDYRQGVENIERTLS
jgi:DNA-binding transcriptional MerR regulator